MSQSRTNVAARGLMWGGRNFKGAAAFKNWLGSRGQSYSRWSKIHKRAARGLKR